MFRSSKKIKREDQRVAILIDVQNMYHSAKNLFNARVNFESIVKEGTSDRKLVRAIAYVVKSGDSEDEKAFFKALKKLGIERKMKDLQVFHGGAKKADWDVGITLDAVNLASSVDVIVLVSGDGDFTPLVQHLKYRGKIVEAMAFKKSASSDLQEEVHSFIDLSSEKKKFLL